MLIRYNVSNFKSIGRTVELNMLTDRDTTDDRFIREIETKAGKWKILQRSGIFGPNASGKSSLIESLAFAKAFIIKGRRSNTGTGVNQFKGKINGLGSVSTFQFIFYWKKEVYDYGFSIDTDRVHDEWLLRLSEQDFEEMFVRKTKKNGITKVRVGDLFAKPGSQERAIINLLSETLQRRQRNQLFLNKLSENGVRDAANLLLWFQCQQFVFPQTKAQALPLRIKNNQKFQKFIESALRRLDTGISAVTTSDEYLSFEELEKKMSLPKKIVEDIKAERAGALAINDDFFIFIENNDKQIDMIKISFTHPLGMDNVDFDLEDESDGTRRLLDLLPMLFFIGKRKVGSYYVDELDRSLHTKLVKSFLDDFIKLSQGGVNQIFFTAHDVNLINLKYFRKEEILFIEKNTYGESRLYSLSDFIINENENVLKSYLSGRFGAVPIIDESSR